VEQGSTRRTMPGGRVAAAELPRGAEGRALCRWCGAEVPRPRRSFCSESCVDAWRLRTSPGYLRGRVYARDKGVCARCTVDTVAALRLLRRARGDRRRELLAIWGLTALTRKSLWDADHIVPVVEGGGECDLGNLRTLCIHCHRVVTRALRDRLRGVRGLAASMETRGPGWRNRQTQRT
jgi:5-methylcytosine-specific restriction enzyme A